MRLLYLFVSLLLYLPFLSAQEDHLCKGHFSIAEQEREQYAQRANLRTNPLTQNYDLKYHRMEWAVDPAVSYIEGKVTAYFVPSEDNFQQLNFDFASELTVNGIRYQGNTINTYNQSTEDNLQIDLPAVIPAGQLDSITIEYEGAPPSDGFGSFEVDIHDNVPVLWTLSEPYGAKDWWPCKQDLNDKIDSIDVIVTTPAAYRVASNGLLVGEELVGDQKVYHWQHRYPITAYLVAIAVTNYTVFSDFVQLDGDDSLEVLNYVYPEALDEAERRLSSTVEMISLFNELFGMYPFVEEKYGHAQFGWAGGMEHQTMSFMGVWNFGLQAHELAHQWFGNQITCGSWQDIWLNEGFATYLTGLAYERIPDGFVWFPRWKQVIIDRVSSEPGGSVFRPDTTTAADIFDSRLAYAKGAYLLRMLQWKLGDENFFTAIRNYLNDPRLSYGYARTRDLIDHLEQVSGEDLDPFFQDWFYGEGFPSYQLHGERTSAGISLTVEQTTSHPSVPFYEMPIPVQLKGEGQDTIVRLDHTFSGQQFNIELSFEVDSIKFDPEIWILSANNTVDFMSTSISERNPLDKAVHLYPNPFGNELYWEIKNSSLEVDRIQVYNAQGQLIRRWSGAGATNKIATENWPNGIYLVQLFVGERWITKKVVK